MKSERLNSALSFDGSLFISILLIKSIETRELLHALALWAGIYIRDWIQTIIEGENHASVSFF